MKLNFNMKSSSFACVLLAFLFCSWSNVHGAVVKQMWPLFLHTLDNRTSGNFYTNFFKQFLITWSVIVNVKWFMLKVLELTESVCWFWFVIIVNVWLNDGWTMDWLKNIQNEIFLQLHRSLSSIYDLEMKFLLKFCCRTGVYFKF